MRYNMLLTVEDLELFLELLFLVDVDTYHEQVSYCLSQYIDGYLSFHAFKRYYRQHCSLYRQL